jgi:hypothetical protein
MVLEDVAKYLSAINFSNSNGPLLASSFKDGNNASVVPARQEETGMGSEVDLEAARPPYIHVRGILTRQLGL